MKLDELDEQLFKLKFLQLLGGQVHVQYVYHKLPLIVSQGKNKCFCKKRQEYLCCSISLCEICICKKYFTNYDEEEINYISSSNIDESDNENLESEIT